MRGCALLTRGTSPATVAVGGTVPLGTTIHRAGGSIVRTGDGIACRGAGYFSVAAKVVATPAAAGTVTVSLVADGVTVDSASATVAAADTAVTLPLVGAVASGCACASRTLTLVLTGAESVVSSATVEVTQVA